MKPQTYQQLRERRESVQRQLDEFVSNNRKAIEHYFELVGELTELTAQSNKALLLEDKNNPYDYKSTTQTNCPVHKLRRSRNLPGDPK